MVWKDSADRPDRIVREPECRELTGMSRTARFELARRGEFPKKIKLSKRASGWRYSDLMDWIISRPVT